MATTNTELIKPGGGLRNEKIPTLVTCLWPSRVYSWLPKNNGGLTSPSSHSSGILASKEKTNRSL